MIVNLPIITDLLVCLKAYVFTIFQTAKAFKSVCFFDKTCIEAAILFGTGRQ